MQPINSAPSFEQNKATLRSNHTLLLFSLLSTTVVLWLSGGFSSSMFTLGNSSPQQNAALLAVPDQEDSEESIDQLVTDAIAFYNSLNSSQQSTLQLTYTAQLARRWSNLPCGTNCRNGLQLGTNLTSAQYQAALQVVEDALGTTTNNGFDEFYGLNMAEAYLHANGGGNGYDSTLRWMAFLNAPTTTGQWMLQFGGHHYAANIAFNNGHVVGATPFFTALEPKTFTYNGVAYDPLGDERDSFRALFASLSSTELSTAHINSSFSDCVMIPGESNGGASSFPSISTGIALSSLTATQQNLALAVINNYVSDIDPQTASSIMSVYTNEITDTYISWRGTGTAGSASSFLNAQGDYMRISGPNVWIEFSCQGGIVIQGQIHYHTIWRDRSHDYGVDLTGDAIDIGTGAGVAAINSMNTLNIFPNPSSNFININFPSLMNNAVLTITDMNGKEIYTRSGFSGRNVTLDVQAYPAGNYFIYVKESGRFLSGKFLKE
jgi:hypothetical protein